MITDDSKCQTTSITMELHGMRHFFIVIVFTVCLFITITSIGVFKTYSKKLIGPSINNEKDRELRRRGIDPFMLHNNILHTQSLRSRKLKTSELQTPHIPYQKQIKNGAKSNKDAHKPKRKEERDTKNKKLHTKKRNSVPVNILESATQRNKTVTVDKNISNTLDSKGNQLLSIIQPSETNDRNLHSSSTTQSVSQTTDLKRPKSMSSLGSKISKNNHTKSLKFTPLTKASKNSSRVSLDFNNPRFKPLKKNNYNNGSLSSKGELKFRSMYNRLKNISRNSFRNNTLQNISRLYGHAFNKTEKSNVSDASIYSRRRFIPPGIADSHNKKNSTNRNQAQPSYVLKYKPLINENKDSSDVKDETGRNIEEFKRTEN